MSRVGRTRVADSVGASRLAMLFAVAGLGLLLASPAQAVTPGAPDLSFSGDGVATTNFGSDVGWKTLVQANGKVIVVGHYHGNTGPETMAVARYLPDGAPDPAFSGDGRQTIAPGATARALAQQPDGRILLAGTLGDDFAIAALTPGGAPDTSFGVGGVATVDFHVAATARSIVVQPDGGLVVAGGAGGHMAVARLDRGGSLDPGFGSGGLATVDFGAPSGAEDVAVQDDGTIVLVGSSQGSLAIAALDRNGDPENGFSGDGQDLQYFEGVCTGNASGRALALEPDGDIVIIGSTGYESYPVDWCMELALLRYKPDGTLDPEFGEGGILVKEYPFANSDFNFGEDVALQADGKILALFIGLFARPSKIARFLPDGSSDPTFFGGNASRVGDSNQQLSGITTQPDGKIVVAGNGETNPDFSTHRLHVAGAPAPDFDADGFRSAEDDCVAIPGTAPRGCPRFHRVLELAHDPSASRFSGVLFTTSTMHNQCSVEQPISLYRERPGDDLRIAGTRTTQSPVGQFAITRGVAAGSYYVATGQSVFGSGLRCGPARSEAVAVP